MIAASCSGVCRPWTRSSREWAKKLEAKPKYVVSTTRRDFPWNNTQHVEGDLARAVKASKKATPRGLLVGSPKLSAAPACSHHCS